MYGSHWVRGWLRQTKPGQKQQTSRRRKLCTSLNGCTPSNALIKKWPRICYKLILRPHTKLLCQRWSFSKVYSLHFIWPSHEFYTFFVQCWVQGGTNFLFTSSLQTLGTSVEKWIKCDEPVEKWGMKMYEDVWRCMKWNALGTLRVQPLQAITTCLCIFHNVIPRLRPDL